MREFYERFLSVRHLPVPVVSCINGAAVGAGLCLAMATDVRVASRSARMGVSFTNLGIHPGMGGSHFLPILVGSQTAARLFLTAELIDAEEALRLGIVTQIAEPERTMPTAIAMARKIASQSAIAVQTTLQTLRARQEVGLEAALRREADAQAICYAHPDIHEGIAAIREKRPPSFFK